MIRRARMILALLLSALSLQPAWAQQETASDADKLTKQAEELFFKQYKIREAIPIAQRAAEIRKNLLGENNSSYASSLSLLGQLYRIVGRSHEAESVLLQSKNIYERFGVRDEQYATVLYALALLYQNLGSFEQARNLLELELTICEQNSREAANGCGHHYNFEVSLLELYEEMGLYDEAYVLLKQDYPPNEVPTTWTSWWRFGDSLEWYANLVEKQGFLDIAERMRVDALKIDEAYFWKTKNDDGFIWMDYFDHLDELVTFYLRQNRIKPVEALRDKKLAMLRSATEAAQKDDSAYTDSRYRLADMLADMGQDNLAETLLLEASASTKNGQDAHEYGESLVRLGEFYLSSSQDQKAESNFREAIAALKPAADEQLQSCDHNCFFYKEVETTIWALTDLAIVYDSMKMHPEAERAIEEARGWIESSETASNAARESNQTYARVLYIQMLLYLETSQKDRAAACAKRLLDTIDYNLENQSSPSEFSVENELEQYAVAIPALIPLASGSTSAAISARSTVITEILRHKGIVFDNDVRNASSGVYDESQNRINALIDEQRRLYLKPPPGMNDEDLRAARKQVDLELSTATGNRSRFEAGEELINIHNFQSALPADAVLIEFYKTPFLDAQNTSRLTPDHYLAVVVYKHSYPAFADLGDAEAIDDLIRRIRSNVAKMAEPGTQEKGKAFERRQEIEFDKLSSKLYEKLFSQVSLRKAIHSSRTIIIAPDGQLNQFSFETLVSAYRPANGTARQPRYLIEEDHQIVYLTTARDLLRKRDPAQEKAEGTVVFASPAYDLAAASDAGQARSPVQTRTEKSESANLVSRGSPRGKRWTTLPGMSREADVVDRLLTNSPFGPVKKFQEQTAVGSTFLNLPAPRLLHIATHGFFVPDDKNAQEDGVVRIDRSTNAMFAGASRGLTLLRQAQNPYLRSGLVFAGANRIFTTDGKDDGSLAESGWITAQDISRMNLRGTELVVLSACESGLGDVRVGDGVQGLQRAFFWAGARSLILSLNEVPDDETSDLMAQFYTGLKNGKNKATALREAELRVLQQRRAKNAAAHPYFWGGFILMGDPN